MENHLSLIQCYYNFIRPHIALKFGKEIRTPAMQAGIVKRKLSFRDIFTWKWEFCFAAVYIFKIEVRWKVDLRTAA